MEATAAVEIIMLLESAVSAKSVPFVAPGATLAAAAAAEAAAGAGAALIWQLTAGPREKGVGEGSLS